MTLKLYDVTPTPAPRQSQRDAWKPSGPVLRYRAFRDEVTLKIHTLPEDYFHAIFLIPMPQSWTKKRKRACNGMKHPQKPDKDNLEKALVDAIYRHGDDSHIWNSSATKLWAWTGGILISDNYIKIDDPGLEHPDGLGLWIPQLIEPIKHPTTGS